MKLAALDGSNLVEVNISTSKSNITFCCEDGRKLVFSGSELAKAVGVANTKILLRHLGYLKIAKYGPGADNQKRSVLGQRLFFFDAGDAESMRLALSEATATQLSMLGECKKGESVQVSVWGHLHGLNAGGIPHIGDDCSKKGVAHGKGSGQAAQGEAQEREAGESLPDVADSANAGACDDDA